MGTDVALEEEASRNPSCIKVHSVMCSQLLELVGKISKLVPDIEAAQPRCSAGIQALCLLQNAMEKARLLVKSCCESSKLYLAITGDAIVSRCQRTRKLFEESLSQLQTMVPVALELQISQIINDLRCAVFTVDSTEEEAGKAMRALLQQDKSGSNTAKSSEIEALQFAASRLNLLSPKDLLIEKRSIRKLLDKVTDGDVTKNTILKYLLHLVKRYEKLIMGEQTENPSLQHDGSFSVSKSYSKSVEGQRLHLESRLGNPQDGAQPDMLCRPMPPEEFRCPICLRLMYDPVVISSGQTFERMCIQKWFDDGHDACPKTRMKLANLSLTPNSAMRDLISKWCMEYGINISDPSLEPSAFGSLETSFGSVTSSGSSLRGLNLQMNLSNVSLGSLDTSYSSDFSHDKIEDGSSAIGAHDGKSSHRFQFFSSLHDIERWLLSNLSKLPWESQCMAIEDVNHYLKHYETDCVCISSDNLSEPLIKFLKDALEKHDVSAQRAGAQLFLTYLSICRSQITFVSGDACTLLTSLVETEATEEALAIMELLSSLENCGRKLAASGAFTTILKILDSQNKDFQEASIQILYNLSLGLDVRSDYVPLECIPKLVPFLSDSSLAGRCIIILKKLSDIEAAKISIAETKGCIPSIAELLETGSSEDQEHAVSIFLSLCSKSTKYCQIVMDEGIIPALVNVSHNGSDKGKIIALELLRLLRHIDYEEHRTSAFDGKVSNNPYELSEQKLSSKRTGFFGRKLAFFSKPSSLSLRKT
ncbi:hypothetical protein Ancab_025837 [Ancistrocladus abbreviatus]